MNKSLANYPFTQVAASAYIENYAMKLFLAADKLDRAANFGKNVVKMFYSSGVLFDVMESCFGELPPEEAHYRKYAKKYCSKKLAIFDPSNHREKIHASQLCSYIF